MRMNLKEVCQLDSNSLTHSLSCSLTVTSRFLVTIVISHRAGGGASKKR